MMEGHRVKLTEVNPYLVCVLCHGYLVDATTIAECLHSFCRSCIFRQLSRKSICPICETQVHNTKLYKSLRPDKTLQDIVYKLVPGLFHNEMKRRREFYRNHPYRDEHLEPECRGVGLDRLIYSPDDLISLSLEFYDEEREKEEWSNHGSPKPAQPAPSGPKRYLQCPAGFKMLHLKKFLRQKYGLSPSCNVDIMYRRECLPDSYSLMDVAYIYTWKRNSPMRFYYRMPDVVMKQLMAPPLEDPLITNGNSDKENEVAEDTNKGKASQENPPEVTAQKLEAEKEDDKKSIFSKKTDEKEAKIVESREEAKPKKESVALPSEQNGLKPVSKQDELPVSALLSLGQGQAESKDDHKFLVPKGVPPKNGMTDKKKVSLKLSVNKIASDLAENKAQAAAQQNNENIRANYQQPGVQKPKLIAPKQKHKQLLPKQQLSTDQKQQLQLLKQQQLQHKQQILLQQKQQIQQIIQQQQELQQQIQQQQQQIQLQQKQKLQQQQQKIQQQHQLQHQQRFQATTQLPKPNLSNQQQVLQFQQQQRLQGTIPMGPQINLPNQQLQMQQLQQQQRLQVSSQQPLVNVSNHQKDQLQPQHRSQATTQQPQTNFSNQQQLQMQQLQQQQRFLISNQKPQTNHSNQQQSFAPYQSPNPYIEQKSSPHHSPKPQTPIHSASQQQPLLSTSKNIQPQNQTQIQQCPTQKADLSMSKNDRESNSQKIPSPLLEKEQIPSSSPNVASLGFPPNTQSVNSNHAQKVSPAPLEQSLQMQNPRSPRVESPKIKTPPLRNTPPPQRATPPPQRATPPPQRATPPPRFTPPPPYSSPAQHSNLPSFTASQQFQLNKNGTSNQLDQNIKSPKSPVQGTQSSKKNEPADQKFSETEHVQTSLTHLCGSNVNLNPTAGQETGTQNQHAKDDLFTQQPNQIGQQHSNPSLQQEQLKPALQQSNPPQQNTQSEPLVVNGQPGAQSPQVTLNTSNGSVTITAQPKNASSISSPTTSTPDSSLINGNPPESPRPQGIHQNLPRTVLPKSSFVNSKPLPNAVQQKNISGQRLKNSLPELKNGGIQQSNINNRLPTFQKNGNARRANATAGVCQRTPPTLHDRMKHLYNTTPPSTKSPSPNGEKSESKLMSWLSTKFKGNPPSAPPEPTSPKVKEIHLIKCKRKLPSAQKGQGMCQITQENPGPDDAKKRRVMPDVSIELMRAADMKKLESPGGKKEKRPVPGLKSIQDVAPKRRKEDDSVLDLSSGKPEESLRPQLPWLVNRPPHFIPRPT